MDFKRVDTTGVLYWDCFIGEPKHKPCIELSEERKRFVLKLIVAETPGADVMDEAKRRVRARDVVCRDCGSSSRLECHHLIPVDVDPFKKADENNMILVCQKCHRHRHSKAFLAK